MSSYEQLSLFITGIGVLVGFGVLVIYYYQLKAMNASVEQSALAATAAKASADALTSSERAWVKLKPFIGPIQLSIDRNNRPLSITFMFTNWGRSPAWISEVAATLMVAEAGIDLAPDYSKCAIVERDSVLLPDENTRLFHTRLDGNPATIPGGRFVTYFYGFVRYKDIFGVSRETLFCRTPEIGPSAWNPVIRGVSKWSDSGPPEANRET